MDAQLAGTSLNHAVSPFRNMLNIILIFASAFAAAAHARLSCKVPHIGGGRDDGPAINAAFERCAKNGKVVLDQYYSVDSLLFTTGLDDVEIELSGTRAFQIHLHSNRDYD